VVASPAIFCHVTGNLACLVPAERKRVRALSRKVGRPPAESGRPGPPQVVDSQHRIMSAVSK